MKEAYQTFFANHKVLFVLVQVLKSVALVNSRLIKGGKKIINHKNLPRRALSPLIFVAQENQTSWIGKRETKLEEDFAEMTGHWLGS